MCEKTVGVLPHTEEVVLEVGRLATSRVVN